MYIITNNFNVDSIIDPPGTDLAEFGSVHTHTIVSLDSLQLKCYDECTEYFLTYYSLTNCHACMHVIIQSCHVYKVKTSP